MSHTELSNLILDHARQAVEKGPGFAQQGGVLWEVTERLRAENNLQIQQEILTAWHDLFREGKLSWGYNIDNPDAPFFHLPKDSPERAKSLLGAAASAA